jgi:hypothetical protein
MRTLRNNTQEHDAPPPGERTESTLKCDPKTGRILGNKEASALWSREYRKGWEPKV